MSELESDMFFRPQLYNKINGKKYKNKNIYSLTMK